MARIRTFIAIELARDLRDRLVALQETLGRSAPDVKWVEPPSLHVTLLFLGEVEDRDLPAICRAVQESVAGRAGFLITIDGVGCFPNRRRPRILWAGIGEGVQEVVAIHDALEPPLLDLGCYRREERRYSPHVTLGRVRNGGPVSTATLTRALDGQAGWKGGEQAVHTIHVMASELSPDGPAYTILARAPLAG